MEKRRFILTILICFMAAACSEKIDINVGKMDRTYLVVEAFLTDNPDAWQSVKLSESVDYFSDMISPAVTDAVVCVDDGGEPVRYVEDADEPGSYYAPKGFCGKPGRKYHLTIDATMGGVEQSYEAWSTMPEAGFRLDSIDYAYAGNKALQIDSLWSVFIWGEDMPQTGYFYISGAVNGNVFPYNMSMTIDDKYFAGQKVQAFPITMLVQTERNRKRYGACCKYLETGDIITISALTLPEDCYKFFSALASNVSGNAIPMFSSQPANCPTNISGGDAMGFFAACPYISASRVVDNPFRMTPLSMTPGSKLQPAGIDKLPAFIHDGEPGD